MSVAEPENSTQRNTLVEMAPTITPRHLLSDRGPVARVQHIAVKNQHLAVKYHERISVDGLAGPKTLGFIGTYFSENPNRYAVFLATLDPHTIEVFALPSAQAMLDEHDPVARRRLLEDRKTGLYPMRQLADFLEAQDSSAEDFFEKGVAIYGEAKVQREATPSGEPSPEAAQKFVRAAELFRLAYDRMPNPFTAILCAHILSRAIESDHDLAASLVGGFRASAHTALTYLEHKTPQTSDDRRRRDQLLASDARFHALGY